MSSKKLPAWMAGISVKDRDAIQKAIVSTLGGTPEGGFKVFQECSDGWWLQAPPAFYGNKFLRGAVQHALSEEGVSISFENGFVWAELSFA